MIRILLFLTILLSSWSAFASDCYTILTQLRYARFAREQLGDHTPLVLLSDGTEVPIARAFEKEGLLYSDIAEWFPSAKPEAADKLRARLDAELNGTKPRNLLRWLKRYSEKYRAKGVKMPPKKWEALDPKAQLEYILAEKDFFKLISVKGREDMFYDGVLTFDELAVTAATPARLTVGDDLGSYEVRSKGGSADRTQYMNDRKIVEEFLEGRVGHQHKVHAWPLDATKRRLMAPKYIELLDAGTWYLYWRQVKRNPSFVESILSHPYLGVYTRWWLLRLHDAVVNAKPENFKNKYRMIGARNFKADPTIEKQDTAGPVVPDMEIRSGNKSDYRDFVDDMIEARIASGDYNGLRDFRDYNFDPSAPTEALTYKWLNEKEAGVLKRFEAIHPFLRYSPADNAHNHVRTKIIAPLLPWESRLDIGYKRDLLFHQQKLYAKRLAGIARDFLPKFARAEKAGDKEAAREAINEASERMERSAYRFADKTRLDLDFERYLEPTPAKLPSIQVQNTGPIDVNQIATGVEYSFRFPAEVKITSREIADREILRTLERIQAQFGPGKIERLDDGGHGHGASVRYRYTDPHGRVWRAEWDGIQREYVEGKLMNPHGGHVETPSPKYVPKDPSTDIAPLFRAARSNGQRPKRSAGGGHVNTDLAPIKALGNKEGPRKILNLVAYHESNRDMITFLWMHPRRAHSARAIELPADFAEKLESFNGDWNDLAVFLYENRYFNVYETRKPRYVEMDITGLMGPAVPLKYKKGTLDIKNPTQKWFPDFGTGKDRIEHRLYDAPENELMAALQLKYHRAMLNKAFNSPEPLRLAPKYKPGVKETWKTDAKAFVEAAHEHLRDLGLDPAEFATVIQQAWDMQQEAPASPRELKKYKKFLPARDPRTDQGFFFFEKIFAQLAA